MKSPALDIRVAHEASRFLIHDAAALALVPPDFFTAEYWRARGAREQRGGRNSVWFLQTAEGDWVLRHYRRGGLIGRWVDDRYVWLGAERSRAFREWRLLAHLHALGLPVPRPLAAQVQRQGAFCRADLVTWRIADAQPLSACLKHAPMPDSAWQRLGATLARFARANIAHADLNAHNILCRGDEASEFFVIDFDRGRADAPGQLQRRALPRLRHSLEKLKRQQQIHFTAADWAALEQGFVRDA